jgi:alpha-tubulin suppressor-like RCC1 family protein
MAVALGDCFSLVLTEDGDMFSFGENRHGELGIGSATLRQQFPVKVESNDGRFPLRHTMVSAGLQHAASVTEDGRVYTWGNKSNGRLGVIEVSAKKFISGPQRLIFGQPALAVACGDAFTLLLTLEGRIWSCGMAMDGQLGHGNDTTDKYSMTEIDGAHFCGVTILAIAAGSSHCIALGKRNDSNTHSLWTWGSNSHGQLGHNDQVTRYVPTCMQNRPRNTDPLQEASSESGVWVW